MKDDTHILKLIYTLFLGIMLAVFIGVAIETFYPQPVAPKYPNEISNSFNKEPTAQQIALENDYSKKMDEYNTNKMNPYNRNVSAITLGAAVLLLALSIFLEKKSVRVISDGVMLGGLLALMYGMGRGLASQESKYMFVAVTVGLIVVLYLGYHRFVRVHEQPAKTAK